MLGAWLRRTERVKARLGRSSGPTAAPSCSFCFCSSNACNKPCKLVLLGALCSFPGLRVQCLGLRSDYALLKVAHLTDLSLLRPKHLP